MTAFRRLLTTDPMAVVWPAAIFGLVMLVGWAVRRVVLRLLNAWTRRTQSRAGLILTEAIKGPFLIWTAILGLHIALQSSGLPAKFTAWSAKTLLVLWIVSLTMMSMRIAGDMVRHYGGQGPGALPVTTLTQNLAQLTVAILGIALLMQEFGVKITPILTALGVGGLAVALAMQDTLSNLFAGFYMAMAGQIRLGDYIKLSSGEEGYVADIAWRSTMVRALANNLIIIPNAKLSQAIVTNYHLPEKRMGVGFQVNVAFGSDPEHIERVLLEVATQGARQIPGMLAESTPSVAFDPGFGDYFLAFTLSYQVAEFADQWPVRAALRKRILQRFKEEGIRLPYPVRTVYLQREQKSEARSHESE
ncbi:MAG: mechanosensitive ion channel family protein [Bryobacteraceae bacterium]